MQEQSFDIMSNIKKKRRRNDVDELIEHPQNVEIIKKLNIIFEKIIQSEKKDNDERTFNDEFNKNDVISYTALIEKKQARKI